MDNENSFNSTAIRLFTERFVVGCCGAKMARYLSFVDMSVTNDWASLGNG